MTRFALRCTMALLAGMVVWPLRAAELPPKFDTPGALRDFVCIIGGFPCSGEAPVTPTMILEKALMMTMDRIRDWMIESDRNTKALQDDVKTLQKDVADLKAGRQQPGGGSRPADDARIAALEARVAKLEADRSAVRAPFQVLGASGQVLMRVDERGNLTLGASGGSRLVFTHQDQGHAALTVNSAAGKVAALMVDTGGRLMLENGSGGTRVEASAGDTPTIGLSSRGQAVEMGVGQELFGLKLAKDGKPAAVIGTIPGRGVALRLYDDAGKVVAGAGSNPAAGGAGLVFVGTGKGTNSAALGAEADGSGVVQAFTTDGKVGASLVGKDRMIAAYNAAGSAVATMGKSEQSEGGNVTARNPDGDGILRAGFRADIGGGEACVYREKRQNVFCLGIGVPGMGIGK